MSTTNKMKMRKKINKILNQQLINNKLENLYPVFSLKNKLFRHEKMLIRQQRMLFKQEKMFFKKWRYAFWIQNFVFWLRSSRMLKFNIKLCF